MNLTLTAFVAALSAVPQLLTLADQAVVNTEQLFAGTTVAGSSKFANAEAKLNGWLQEGITDAETLATAVSAIPTLINSAVAGFNASGLFTHKTATPPVTA